jgi:hypothetical protein
MLASRLQNSAWLMLSQPPRPKSVLRLEPGQAEQPLLEKARIEPARLGERGQHQRVAPHREARQQPRQRALARAPAPVHAAEHRRRKLGHRGKADQPDADQRVGLARQAEVQIAEQQQADDGPAPDAEQQAGEVALAGKIQAPAAQQHRHHQVVAHHGRQRDRLDDDHAGGRRQPADEHEQRERRVVVRHRQGEHEGVRIHRTLAEMQQAADGDRDHEDVDQQQDSRNDPGGAAQVLLVDVLDHRDLELARQEDHRQHRQQHVGEPAAVAQPAHAIEGEHVGEFGRRPWRARRGRRSRRTASR